MGTWLRESTELALGVRGKRCCFADDRGDRGGGGGDGDRGGGGRSNT